MNNMFPLARAALLAVAVLASGAPAAAPAGSPQQYGLPDFADLVDKVGPAVVAIRITTRQSRDEAAADKKLRDYFSRPPSVAHPRETVRKGAGFLISPDGYVLSAHSVLRDAEQVVVELADGREFPARVAGTDERSDLVLLKIDGQKLPRMQIGDSGKIRAGEWVLAIGSPFQLAHSVSVGVISFKSRDIGGYLPLIQTDVMSNPGSAGGPLINLRGEVIGVASQMATRSGHFDGVSLAVPINDAMEIAEQLKVAGKVTRGVIGITASEVSRLDAGKLGLNKARGAQVAVVEPGSLAEQGGIRSGDIILAFNGKPVATSADLPRLVGRAPVGSRASVTVWRNGAQQELVVTVGGGL